MIIEFIKQLFSKKLENNSDIPLPETEPVWPTFNYMELYNARVKFIYGEEYYINAPVDRAVVQIKNQKTGEIIKEADCIGELFNCPHPARH
jgi:hypothetical protein